MYPCSKPPDSNNQLLNTPDNKHLNQVYVAAGTSVKHAGWCTEQDAYTESSSEKPAGCTLSYKPRLHAKVHFKKYEIYIHQDFWTVD